MDSGLLYFCIRFTLRDICILMKAAQEECQSGKGLKWRGMYANLNSVVWTTQHWQGTTQDPERIWSWLVSPAYSSLKPCISWVLSQFHPNRSHFALQNSSHSFLQKNFFSTTSMSENVPPQQQFYPNQHVIQHWHAQMDSHQPLSGVHPMVGSISQVINNFRRLNLLNVWLWFAALETY